MKPFNEQLTFDTQTLPHVRAVLWTRVVLNDFFLHGSSHTNTDSVSVEVKRLRIIPDKIIRENRLGKLRQASIREPTPFEFFDEPGLNEVQVAQKSPKCRKRRNTRWGSEIYSTVVPEIQDAHPSVRLAYLITTKLCETLSASLKPPSPSLSLAPPSASQPLGCRGSPERRER